MGDHFDAPYNVVAAFEREGAAQTAVELLEDQGVPASSIHVHHPDAPLDEDALAELRAEMQDELVESWAAPSFYMTRQQARGAFWGTVIFAVPAFLLGAAIGAVWAAYDDSLLGWWGQVLMVALLAALCGGTIGFLTGGGLAPRFEAADDPARPFDDPRTIAERDVLVAVHAQEQTVAERAAELLRGVGAEKVALVDRHGDPLPPQARTPRPADPEGFWWRHAGEG